MQYLQAQVDATSSCKGLTPPCATHCNVRPRPACCQCTALSVPSMPACVQDNDMVMNRGHAMDWFSNEWGANHWSRALNCTEYRCGQAKCLGAAPFLPYPRGEAASGSDSQLTLHIHVVLGPTCRAAIEKRIRRDVVGAVPGIAMQCVASMRAVNCVLSLALQYSAGFPMQTGLKAGQRRQSNNRVAFTLSECM